jgi:hypothetical protein
MVLVCTQVCLILAYEGVPHLLLMHSPVTVVDQEARVGDETLDTQAATGAGSPL